MILVLDNYDSFVHNLARYFVNQGRTVDVVRSDSVDVAGVAAFQPEAIVLSPGPCTPNEAGCCVDVVRAWHGSIPILGVCLGHQAIGQAFGAEIRRTAPVHGSASWIDHDGCGVFTGLPNPLAAGRYHSLAVAPETLPPQLEASAFADDGVLMALRHRTSPLVGLQFHPESILTEQGEQLIANFLAVADAWRAAPRQATVESA